MISIVVPACNEEKLIVETLDSLKKQDFPGEYEIIVVDNGSHDNTSRIAGQMGVTVISCPRKGVSYARQRGAEAARGEIIVQADADTIYPPGWLARIAADFKKHPRATAVAGTFMYKNPPWWAGLEYFLRVFFGSLSTLVFGRPLVISGANFAFYKQAFLRIGGYENDVYSSDQINIATRLSSQGKVIYDPRLVCRTSARSVAKPVLSILVAFIRNLSYFSRYVFSSIRISSMKRMKKISSFSTGTYLKIAIPVLVIGILCYGYFIPASPVFGKVYYRSVTSDKVIALTFDDGPNEPYTSQVLGILREYDVHATFFLVGYNVSLYPDTARQILADGNVIGNHSYYHNANHALTFNSDKEIMAAQQAIYNTTGVQPHLYRPPHGRKSPWELDEIKHDGFAEILWSISTNELSGRPPEFLAGQIVKKARPGGIILLHDGYGISHDSTRSNKSETVTMLPLIIERLEAEGYSFVTIPELLRIPAYNRTGN